MPLVFGATLAHAATFDVDSTGDQPDAVLNGTCATAVASCTLRAAIQEANNAVGPHTINFIIPGAGPHTISPASALPALNQAITINGYSQAGASPNTLAVGNDAVLKIELDGSAIVPDAVNGLTINAASCAVRGLVINRFTGYGIAVNATGGVIRGNFVGTNVAGSVGLGNNRGGVGSEGGIGLFAGSATIGGNAPADRNLVAGNNANCGRGIELWDSSGNTIQGNYVGTNAAGTAAIPNGCGGIVLDGNPGVGSDNNTVGGAVAGAGNLVSGNQVEGIFVQVGSANNTIQGNTIGLNAAGSAALPNAVEGIKIFSTANVVGGDDVFKRNVISGNTGPGVRLQGAGATANAIRGNFIGTDVTGALAVGNGSHGVILNAGASGNTIGGSAAERNVISGNGSGPGVQGVRIDGAATTGNVLTANFIGTDAAGTGALPNSAGGVAVTNGSASNTIGGIAAGAGNRIALNTTYGINIALGAGGGNAILGNAIFGNTALGIDLLNDGATLNDPGDGDAGPNDLLNFPQLTAATLAGGSVTMSFQLDVPAASYRIEFFTNPSGADPSGYGEGQVYVGSRNVTHPGGGAVAFTFSYPGAAGDVVTATTTLCTDGASCAAFGSSSEFSNALTVSCCALTTSEGAATVTVAAAGQFEMTFDAAVAGGAIARFYDLAEDPARANDLAGSLETSTGPRGLHNFGMVVGGVSYNSSNNVAGARLDLLEATATRVRVRQEAFYQTGAGGAILAGAKGTGDYSVYPAGRAALRFERRATAAVAYTADYSELVVHRLAAAPLDGWTIYRELGTIPPNGTGNDAFVMAQNELAGGRTDFLQVLHKNWTAANGYPSDADLTSATTNPATERINTYWDDLTAGALSAGTRHVWDSLTYFKPTGFTSQADAAVTSRSADYRTHPAGEVAINGGKGSGWADAAENTVAGTDWYNESEAAYLFELHQTLGLDFTLDGATTKRYSPFFKIRQWRSFVEAPSVTFDADGAGPGPAVSLRRNLDYKATLKPFARGHYALSLSWHSTLESAAAVIPLGGLDVGANGSANTSGCPGPGNCVDFVAGRYGNGASFDANTDYVASAASTDIAAGGGAIEFWYQPSYDHTDTGTHPLWYWQWGAAPDANCYILEHYNQQLVFRVARNYSDTRCTIADGNSGQDVVTVASASYSWRAFDWVHLRAEWKSGVTNYLRLYLDKQLVGSSGFTTPGGSPLSSPSYIGGCGISCPGPGASSGHPAGIIDEFHLYTNNGPPVDTVGYAGLVGDGREYLADSGLNTGLFAPKNDGFRRGRYLYLGSDAKFRGVNVSLVSAGGGVNPSLQWDYWNGTAWADLPAAATGFTDGTNHFRQTGTVSWSVEPGNWDVYSVNGGPDLYYVRVWLPTSSDDYAPAPVERQIRTDILLFQYCADVTTAAQFAFAVPPTTEVTLLSLSATAGDASVLVEWRTASELRNLGFHLYRAPSADGPWTRLSASLVPGLGSSAVGQAYAWRDSGLSNGTRYYYRLEDVDASSKVTSHGPISAVPHAAAAGSGAAGASSGGDAPKPGASSSCPAWVVRAYAAAAGTDASGSWSCTRHGEPEATSLDLVSRDASQATVELRTGGFYTLQQQGGAVQVFVPGFDFSGEEQAAALPLRRALVEAAVGRRVELGGVRARELVGYRGLAPSALGAPEMQVSHDGTARAVRRGPREQGRARPQARRGEAPRAASGTSGGEWVKLLPSVFQGETKSAVLELQPLHYASQRRELVLAKRLRVRLLFRGRDPLESGRGRAARSLDKAPTGEVLARLYTTVAGLHTVGFEQLFTGATRALAVSALRLERQGEVVAFHVEPQGDRFGPGSRLYFYAERGPASTDYAGEVAYELVSSRDGVAMAVVVAAPSSAPIASDSVVTRTFEANRFYQPGLLEAEDPWLWEAVASGTTRAVSLALTGTAASGTAELSVELQGASASGQSVDHHLAVSLNGTLVGEAQFAGKTPYRVSLSLPASLLREGTNELQLTNVADTGVTSLVFLDRVTLVHPQRSSAAGGRFEGVWPQSGTATVSGLTGPAVLVEPGGGVASATSASAGTRWLTGFREGGAGDLRFHAEAGRRYLAVSQPLVARVSAPEPSTLRESTNRADYLLIAPKAFLAAAEPLLARRHDQGLTVQAVAFEEIASEFGHGQPSAEAIRSFLGHAYQSWRRPSPRYVLLLGDASYDPRNFSGTSRPSPLPALWTKTSYLWTASDPLLGAINGEDSLPDVAIGRLPAATLEQAQALVAKLLAWEQSGQGLTGVAALVADNPDPAGDFEADAEDIRASFLASRPAQVLRLSELGAGTRPAIRAALDDGLGLLSYVGHGGAAVWASENVWNSWDADSLQVQSRQPLLVTMNCLNGYFVAPAFESLAESLLKAEGRGVVAAFSPSGLSLDGPAHQYHRALMAELLSGRHARLGDAVLAAQRAYAESGLMPELLSVYHLLGDPATVLR